MVPTDSIKYARFNPKSRIDKKRLAVLRESIGKYGILTPLALSKDLILADGHRRIECAKELGIKEVPVIVHNMSLEELWKQNETTLPIKGATWWEAVVNGYPIELVPHNPRWKLNRIMKLVGADMFDEMGANGTSPTIYETAVLIRNKLPIEYKNDDYVSKIILWLYTYKQQKIALAIIHGGGPIEPIVKAVNEDKPIKRVYLVE